MIKSVEVHYRYVIRYFLVVLFCVALVLVTGAKFFYLLTALLIGWGAVNTLILWVNTIFLIASFHISASTITAGESLALRYRLLNNSILPIFDIAVKPVISKELGEVIFDFGHDSFTAFEIKDIERHLKCDRRGFYSAGEIIMELSDPLGFFTWTMTRLKPIEVTVYPRIYPFRRTHREVIELFGSKSLINQKKEDQTAIKSVRKYFEGDSARSIHWPLTAKTSELQMKEFSNASDLKTYLFVDGYSVDAAQNPDRYDEIAEVAVSIAACLLKEGRDTVMVINDRHRTECHGVHYKHMTLFLNKLTAFIPDGQLEFNEFLKREARRFQEGAELIVAAGPISQSLADTLRSLTKRGFVLVCYTIDDTSNAQEWSDKLRSRSLDLIPLKKAAELSLL